MIFITMKMRIRAPMTPIMPKTAPTAPLVWRKPFPDVSAAPVGAAASDEAPDGAGTENWPEMGAKDVCSPLPPVTTG